VAVPEEIEAVAGRVRERARGDRQALLLATVPGLGCYTALLARAEIRNVSRFPMARLLSSCAGLVPSTYASGGVVTHGAITRRGPRFVCWTLVEAAMHVVGRPGPLQEFYRRLLVGKSAQKAVVAAARKASKAVFRMLRTGRSSPKVEPSSCLPRMRDILSSGRDGECLWAVFVGRRLVARREMDMPP
jgi:transposase